MLAPTRFAADSSSDQRYFPSLPGYTVRTDFAEGELSFNLGSVVLGAVDRRIGMISKLAANKAPRDAAPPLWPVASLTPVLKTHEPQRYLSLAAHPYSGAR